jgi:hypothetical protein
VFAVLHANGAPLERFIQTSLREWGYARAYPTSRHRKDDMPICLHHYNRASQHPSVYVVEENRLC